MTTRDLLTLFKAYLEEPDDRLAAAALADAYEEAGEAEYAKWLRRTRTGLADEVAGRWAQHTVGRADAVRESVEEDLEWAMRSWLTIDPTTLQEQAEELLGLQCSHCLKGFLEDDTVYEGE